MEEDRDRMRDNERGRKRKLIGHKRIERENERGETNVRTGWGGDDIATY